MFQPSENLDQLSLDKISRKNGRRRKSPIAGESIASDGHYISSPLTLFDLSIHILDMSPSFRLLVCSIGNPGTYLNTLHSAGHTVLSSLASSLSYPSFQRSRSHGNGLVSAGSEFTLWQSSSLMNISGVGVAAAWREFLKEGRGEEARLVVVHDELELALGQVKVKSGTASAKGHKGLKSVREVLRGVDYTRIGVGIGRPESRETDAVARHVLRKMTVVEREKLEACVERVEDELRRLSA